MINDYKLLINDYRLLITIIGGYLNDYKKLITINNLRLTMEKQV